MTSTTLRRIYRINISLPDHWPLCEFAGKTEAEVMICQTLRACIVNHMKHGETFSFKSSKLRIVTSSGLGDNPAGYQLLLDRGWVEEKTLHLVPATGYDDTEEDEDGLPIGIFPTDKLLDSLERHLEISVKQEREP